MLSNLICNRGFSNAFWLNVDWIRKCFLPTAVCHFLDTLGTFNRAIAGRYVKAVPVSFLTLSYYVYFVRKWCRERNCALGLCKISQDSLGPCRGLIYTDTWIVHSLKHLRRRTILWVLVEGSVNFKKHLQVINHSSGNPVQIGVAD